MPQPTQPERVDMFDPRWHSKGRSKLARAGCVAAMIAAPVVGLVSIEGIKAVGKRFVKAPLESAQTYAAKNYRMISYGGDTYVHIRGSNQFYRIGGKLAENGDGTDDMLGKLLGPEFTNQRTDLRRMCVLLNGGDPRLEEMYFGPDLIIREEGVTGSDIDPSVDLETTAKELHQQLQIQFAGLPYGHGTDKYPIN